MAVRLELIGNALALDWGTGEPDFIPVEYLRAHSPSAEVAGEVDVMGQRWGGEAAKSYAGVLLLGWDTVGNYAVRMKFSDGHQSGLYSFDYLKHLAVACR